MVRRGREFWISAVADYERGKLTQEAFALRRGVSPATLQWWIYKLRAERKASVSLVPVRVIASSAPPARDAAADREIEIELRSGVRLRITASVDVEYVAALAQRLG